MKVYTNSHGLDTTQRCSKFTNAAISFINHQTNKDSNHKNNKTNHKHLIQMIKIFTKSRGSNLQISIKNKKIMVYLRFNNEALITDQEA